MTWFTSFLYSQFLVTPPYPATSFLSQTIIITGSNTGLGLGAAHHFLRLQASKIILAVRSLNKGAAAKASLASAFPALNVDEIVEVWQLDLSSFESVKEFAEKVKKLERLDVLLENAGIGTSKFEMSEGYESTIKVNVLSTELLALLLLPKMRETASKFNVVPRLSIVTSDLLFLVKFPESGESDIFEKLNGEKKFAMMERYVFQYLVEEGI